MRLLSILIIFISLTSFYSASAVCPYNPDDCVSAVCPDPNDCVVRVDGEGLCVVSGQISVSTNGLLISCNEVVGDTNCDGYRNYCVGVRDPVSGGGLIADCGTGCTDCCPSGEVCSDYACVPSVCETDQVQCESVTCNNGIYSGTLLFEAGTAASCCGNDATEHYVTCMGDDAQSNIHGALCGPTPVSACCNNAMDCPYTVGAVTNCYSQNQYVDTIDFSVDNEYCWKRNPADTFSTWTDMDYSQSVCCYYNTCGASKQWLTSGCEPGAGACGECDDYNLVASDGYCCGDDPNEFPKTHSFFGVTMCCSKSTDSVLCYDASHCNCCEAGQQITSTGACTTCKAEGGTCTVNGNCCQSPQPQYCDTTNGANKCCPTGQYWVAVGAGGSCENAEPCGVTAPKQCLFRPPNDPTNPQSGWFGNDPGCIDISESDACCWAFQNGEWDYWWTNDAVVPY